MCIGGEWPKVMLETLLTTQYSRETKSLSESASLSLYLKLVRKKIVNLDFFFFHPYACNVCIISLGC